MMAAGRLQRAASAGLAVCCGLLAATLFGRCSLYREYVRRGQVMDTLVSRLDRLEQAQQRQHAQTTTLRADALTEMEQLGARLDQVEARITDLGDRLDRISRRLGVGRGDLTTVAPDSTARTNTGPVRPDTGAAPVDTQPLGIDPDRMYNTAYLDFTRGKYQVAIAGFRRYLEMFPDSEMADNARYWVGECQYSLGRMDSAEVEFRQVLTDYPGGNKAPAAAYKLGLVFETQGRSSEARKLFEDVVREFPGSTEARLAQERLKVQE
jgi:tol-pal system protein YbgF